MGKYAREKFTQVMLWKSTKLKLDLIIKMYKKEDEWSYNDVIRELIFFHDISPNSMH